MVFLWVFLFPVLVPYVVIKMFGKPLFAWFLSHFADRFNAKVRKQKQEIFSKLEEEAKKAGRHQLKVGVGTGDCHCQ